MRRTLLAMLLALALVTGATGLALADEGDDDNESSDGGKARGKGQERGGDGDDDKDDGDGRGRGRGGHAEFAKRGDKWLLRNDDVAVWFHQNPSGKAKPDLRVALNGTDDERAGYRVKILRLCEVDEEMRCTGKYPRMNLAKSQEWNVVTETTNESLTLTMVHAEAQGVVTLVWRLDTTNAAVKYDLLVENWKWGDPSHRLMLDMLVLGKNLKNATGANVSVEDSGYVQWEPTALATYGANDTRTIPVEGWLKPMRDGGDDDEEDEDEKRAESGGHIYLLFNATGGWRGLDYDPTFGVQSAGAPQGVSVVPALGLVAGVAVLGAAAWALRRRF